MALKKSYRKHSPLLFQRRVKVPSGAIKSHIKLTIFQFRNFGKQK